MPTPRTYADVTAVETYTAPPSPLPDTAELAAMRSAAGETLTASMAVRRRVRARTATGGHTDTWVDVAAAVPCRVGPPSRGDLDRTAALQLARAPRWVVSSPFDVDVRPGDRVLVTGGPAGWLELVGWLNEGATLAVLRRWAAIGVGGAP